MVILKIKDEKYWKNLNGFSSDKNYFYVHLFDTDYIRRSGASEYLVVVRTP